MAELAIGVNAGEVAGVADGAVEEEPCHESVLCCDGTTSGEHYIEGDRS
jgi:hypothetical protein